MLSKSLSTSQKFAALVQQASEMFEFCHALYPLIVTHTDDFGRLQGDPFTVKLQCYPASPRSLDDFSDALRHLHDVGLIAWYCVSGKHFIQIANFEPHQQGLHRRTRSQFPRVPGNSGNEAEVPGQEKGTEGKGREEKKGADRQAVRPAFEVYHRLFIAKYGGKPEYAGEKDGARMKRLLKAHGLGTVSRRIQQFFDSADPWIQRSGHTLDVFFAAGTQTKLVAELGRDMASRPKHCKHDPPCADDATHTRRDLEDRRKVS